MLIAKTWQGEFNGNIVNVAKLVCGRTSLDKLQSGKIPIDKIYRLQKHLM